MKLTIKSFAETRRHSLANIESINYTLEECFLCFKLYDFWNVYDHNEKFLYFSRINCDTLKVSKNISFDMKLLKFFDEQIFRNGMTFQGFADGFNNFLNGEHKICRKVLSNVYFYYKIINIVNDENVLVKDFGAKNTEMFLDDMIENLMSDHLKKWSALHDAKCRIKECSKTRNVYQIANFIE